MARLVLLATDSWSDTPLDQLAHQAADWGYQGLDLACWGDHFEVQRALGEEEYCPNKLALFNRLDLSTRVLSVHRTSSVVCGPIGQRHRERIPDYVWGDGDPEGVRERAVEEMLATLSAGEQLGVEILCGSSGSSFDPWSCPDSEIEVARADALDEFVQAWTPILDKCREVGLRYALEVRPGEIAFDYHSCEQVFDALRGREEFGLTLDPSQLFWQGLDPVEFVRRFGQHIFHVHIRDVALALNGRAGLMNSGYPSGDPRRGWDYRSPGRGNIDWESLIRALNEVGYDGALAVDWADPGMNRDVGAEEACKFVRRLDFEAPVSEPPAFE